MCQGVWRGGHHLADGIGGAETAVAQIGVSRKTAIRHGVHGRQNRAVAQAVVRVVHLVLLARPAKGMQFGQRIGSALGRAAAADQALGRQAIATRFGAGFHRRQADVVEDRGLAQGRGIGQRSAWLVDIAPGGVLRQRLHRPAGFLAALLDAERSAGRDLRDRLARHDAVDPTIAVQLARPQHGRATVRCRAGQHQRIGFGERQRIVLAAVLGVEHVEGVSRRHQGVAAPILLGVLLRMRVFDGNAVGEGGVVGRQRRVAQLGGKLGHGACRFARGAGAIHLVHRVVGQVVQANAFAGIGQCHGAAFFQAPFASGANGAVNAARARRGAQDNARLAGVEAVGHQHRHHGLLAARAVVQHGQVLAAGNQTFAARHHAVSAHIRAVQAAIATARGEIKNATVVGEQGVAAQLGHAGLGRVGVSRRSGRAQAGFAQAAGQQILRRGRAAAACAGGRVAGLADFADAGGQLVLGVRSTAAASHQAGCRQRAQAPAHGAQVAALVPIVHVVSCVVVGRSGAAQGSARRPCNTNDSAVRRQATRR